MLFNLPRKNPFKGGPIIDYDLLLLVREVGGGGQVTFVHQTWRGEGMAPACTQEAGVF